MEPVITAAVVTVAVSVINAIVRIAQRRLNVSVEMARISEAGADRAGPLPHWAVHRTCHPP
jgi:hypothetical protein